MLRVISIFLAFLFPFHAYSLGLGEIEVNSFLSQPFDAEIDLVSGEPVELDDIQVKLADTKAFDAAGIERPFLLTKLKFRTGLDSTGNPIVLVSSDNAIREPFLNFILQMRSREGVVRRSYAVLLDPPSYRPAAFSGSQAALSAATESSIQAPQPFSDKAYGPIRSSETLWEIAERTRPDSSVSIEQMMIALQQVNEGAFVDNNVNKLRVGSILEIPSQATIEQIDPLSAREIFLAQTSAWESRSVAPVAVSPKVTKSDATQLSAKVAPSTNNALRVVGVDREWLLDLDSHPGETVYPLSADDQLRENIADTEQDLDAVKQINRDLSNLKLALETKIDTLQNSLAEKNKRIAELEQQLSQMQGGSPVAGSSELESGVADAGLAETGTGADQSRGESVVTSEQAASTPGGVDVSQPMPTADTVRQEAVASEEPAESEVAGEVSESNETSLWRSKTWWAILGLVVVGLLSALYFVLRKTRKQEEEVENLLIPTAADNFVEETRQYEEEIQLGGVFKESEEIALADITDDPKEHLEPADISSVLTEADIYLAYRRYTPAETLIRETMQVHPFDPELKAKLLEIYAFKKDKTVYREYLDEVSEDLMQQSDDLRNRVLDMTRELIPDHPIVLEQNGPTGTNPGRTAETLDFETVPSLFEEDASDTDDISIDDLMVEEEEAAIGDFSVKTPEELGMDDSEELGDIPTVLDLPEDLELELDTNGEEGEGLSLEDEVFGLDDDDHDVIEEIDIQPHTDHFSKS